MKQNKFKLFLKVFLIILLVGLLLPDNPVIPVQGATRSDWNNQSFWHEPWGSSGTHKGIDIFGKKGTDIIAATGGPVIYSGNFAKGGFVVAILGPKWRLHYYAHLQTRSINTGQWASQGEVIGTLGDSGNAQGKQPHVHYVILSMMPYPWKMTTESQGWKKMFYLNPDQLLP